LRHPSERVKATVMTKKDADEVSFCNNSTVACANEHSSFTS